MPHLTLDLSENLIDGILKVGQAFNKLSVLEKLHNTLGEQETIVLGQIKSSAYTTDTFCVGEKGMASGFMHVELALMEGRSDALKQKMRNALSNVLSGFADTVKEGCGYSVVIRDIDPRFYRTHNLA